MQHLPHDTKKKRSVGIGYKHMSDAGAQNQNQETSGPVQIIIYLKISLLLFSGSPVNSAMFSFFKSL